MTIICDENTIMDIMDLAPPHQSDHEIRVQMFKLARRSRGSKSLETGRESGEGELKKNNVSCEVKK